MGNAFMPSVASSLNVASHHSLLDILQQRALAAEMQKQLFAQQRQGAMDQFTVAMRMQDQAQQDRDFTFRKNQAEAKTKAEAEAAATKLRGENNERAAAGMVFDRLAMDPTDRSPGLLRAAHEGKVGVSMLPKEPGKPEPTLEDKAKEAFTLAQARARGTQSVKVAKGPKAAKEDAGLPSGFKQAIQNRMGSTGFENRDAAFASIQKQWGQWRKNYPGLDASKVKSELDNIFGPREGAGGMFVLGASEAFDAASRRAGAAKTTQRY